MERKGKWFTLKDETMKKLPWILVVLLVIACVVTWFRPHGSLPAEIRTETKVNTVVKGTVHNFV